MEILINILWILLWNLLIPTLIGYLFTRYLKMDNKDNIALNFTMGFIIVLGVFQPVILVAIYLKISLTLLTIVTKTIWIVLSVVSLFLNWKRVIQSIKKVPLICKSFNIFMVAAILLIIVQAYVYVGYEHVDDDDAFFVATASTAIANDNLYIQSPYSGADYKSLPTRYILSPFSIYYAVMSNLTDIHPSVYAHLFLPIILLIFVYLTYYLWGKEWFSNSESLGIFIILISFMNIFGNYSEFTTQSFLLFRLWQGKAFLAAGIIPYVLYLCYKIRKEDKARVLWITLLLSTSAASHVSSMGIFLAPIVIGVFAVVDSIVRRRVNKLPAFFICCLPCILCGVIYIIIS
ncbi:MAG: hypothetical protein H2184_04720 [Candidatus Galacturonibacter soehngenii]|nr:hypothetical protein [Candidatus Galacturonibacter soehngenii]